MKDIVAVGDSIIVKVIEEKKPDSLIIVPEKQSAYLTALICSISPNLWEEEAHVVEFCEGDVIVAPARAFRALDAPGIVEGFSVIEKMDIIAVVLRD